jgi:aminoglycoside 3'-phosphotransferase II
LARIDGTLPPAIADQVAGYTLERDTLGYSGATVHRLVRPGAPPLFLKSAGGAQRREIAEEFERLRWARGRLPVPQALAYTETDDAAFLLMTAVPGTNTTDDSYRADVPAMVRELARGLRLIHATPAGDCPFDHRLAAQIAGARARLEAGMVRAEDFDHFHQGRDPHDLFAELLERAAAEQEDVVLTHGDACLPNVLLEQGRLSGFCDMGRLGLSDRYRDLALTARSLTFNWGGEYVPLLFEAYGVAPDQRKIELYMLVDEFF